MGLVVSDKKIFKNCILKTYFWPCDLLMQPIRTIWTILEGDHAGTIPVKFGKIPISGSKDEVVCSFPYIIQCKIVTSRAGSILTPRDNLNNLGRGPIDDAFMPNMKAMGLVVSDKKIFESFILKTYLLTPWPTYATKQNHLNNFCKGPPKDHSCWVWSNSH